MQDSKIFVVCYCTISREGGWVFCQRLSPSPGSKSSGCECKETQYGKIIDAGVIDGAIMDFFKGGYGNI